MKNNTRFAAALLPCVALADVPPDSSPDLVPAIRDHTSDVVRCLGRAHKKGRMPQGTLLVEIDVEDERTSEVAVVDDATQSKGLARCVSRKIGAWDYPSTANGSYTWRFTFRASGGPVE